MSTELSQPPRQAAEKAAHVPHRWRNLAAITGVEVVDNTEAGLLSTLFPAISKSLGLTNGNLGVLSALGKLVAIPFGPAWVWIASRIGRKNALVATTVIGGAFGVAAGFSQNYAQLLILNTLMSASIIGGAPITNAIIADSFDDRSRATATGYYYAAITAASSFLGPVLALFTGNIDGWRYGMWAIGALCIVIALVITLFYTDPGIGAAEKQLADLSEDQRPTPPVTFQSVMSLFKIPTFTIMNISRLLSGHLLISIFGIQFLVKEEGFSNAVAATVLVPFGIGYVAGTLGSGYLVSLLDRFVPDTGRVVFIQAAQFLFAGAAFFGTQFHYGSIAIYGVFWALMGFTQGMNPPVNRPIVMSVVLPELRGQAFAIFLTIAQTLGWAAFALSAGWLADQMGIQAVFMWILVVLMIVNGLILTPLYWCYKRDARRVTDELDHRRAVAAA